MTSMTELTPEDAAELLEAFELFDRDGDKKISIKEFGNVLRALGQNPTEELIGEIMKQTDTNDSRFRARQAGNGFIEYEEYEKLVKSHIISPAEVEKSLKEAFEYFDKDKTGLINLKELKTILTHFGEKLTTKEVENVLKDLDKSGDGKLQYSEVAPLLCKKMMLN